MFTSLKFRFVAALAMCALATGCSSGGGDAANDSGARDAEEPGAIASEEGAQEGTGEEFEAKLPTDQAIIYTAELGLRSDTPTETADEAIDLVLKESGLVSGDERDIQDDYSQVTLTLRVPAESFTDSLDALAKLGTAETSRNVTTEDVQQQVLDLDSAIESKEASVERVRDLMDQAESIDDIVSIEGELTTRETELAALVARERELDDAVSYSTITVTISSPRAPAAEPDRPDGFFEGLAAGWSGFLAVVGFLLTAAGVLLPFAIALAVPAGVLWWYLRRRAASRQTGGPLAATAGPARVAPPGQLPPTPPVKTEAAPPAVRAKAPDDGDADSDPKS